MDQLQKVDKLQKVDSFNELDINNSDHFLIVRVLKIWTRASFKNPSMTYSMEMILLDQRGNRITASCLSRYVENPLKVCFNNDTIVSNVENWSGSLFGFQFVGFDTIIAKGAPLNRSIGISVGNSADFVTPESVNNGINLIECEKESDGLKRNLEEIYNLDESPMSPSVKSRGTSSGKFSLSGSVGDEKLKMKLIESEMGSFQNQVKERAEELKNIVKKGAKIVGDSCKKGWHKVKHIRK
ncbi:hypothetical protein SSX86_032764 [Deinandra increscens subsp. villosa]|uniref:Uncharacterized protein n=1 Tax=Deinandra increscens subsp. villosa TaxID=3103831 RepID=A0AAP0C4H9_9ASTR